MYRSISTQAIVIRRERIGEFHKSLSLLTADLGLISAMAYGAYKPQSRLRLGSEPFTWSSVHLYHNPVKKSYKVTDLEIHASFEGLQGDLSRLAAASLWAEVIQKSFGAGEMTGGLFGLFRESLEILENAEPALESYVTMQFLWRFLALAGYRPGIGSCDSCGASLGERGPAWYAPRSHALLCAACGSHTGLPLPRGALRYLGATQEMPLARAVAVSMDESSRAALRDTLLGMVQSVLEGSLASIPWVRSGR
ncbi:MAG: DNA repair protein RecO [Spirochaetia bacterium]|jgi:DNA repair protein RecO (recombination protein O)